MKAYEDCDLCAGFVQAIMVHPSYDSERVEV
jgi:hypothetical protein